MGKVLMQTFNASSTNARYTKDVYKVYAICVNIYYLLFTGVLAQTPRAEPIVVALGMTFGFRYNILYISI